MGEIPRNFEKMTGLVLRVCREGNLEKAGKITEIKTCEAVESYGYTLKYV